MSERQIKIARVHTLEGHDHFNQVLSVLQTQNIAGVTVLRGIAGVGESGQLHTSSLLSLSLELPIIIEFYDVPERVEEAIKVLQSQLDLQHIVSWSATAHV